jgi:hypothetical protein
VRRVPVRQALLVLAAVASLLLGACGNDGLNSSAVSQLYGGSNSLSSAEIACIDDSGRLDEFVRKARDGNHLNSMVFAEGSTAVGLMLRCFGNRYKTSLVASGLENGRSKEVAQCEANSWVSELVVRAEAGKPIRDLSVATDFDAVAERMKKECKRSDS